MTGPRFCRSAWRRSEAATTTDTTSLGFTSGTTGSRGPVTLAVVRTRWNYSYRPMYQVQMLTSASMLDSLIRVIRLTSPLHMRWTLSMVSLTVAWIAFTNWALASVMGQLLVPQPCLSTPQSG